MAEGVGSMEYVILLSLTLLCYAWLGNRERIVHIVRLRRVRRLHEHVPQDPDGIQTEQADPDRPPNPSRMQERHDG